MKKKDTEAARIENLISLCEILGISDSILAELKRATSALPPDRAEQVWDRAQEAAGCFENYEWLSNQIRCREYPHYCDDDDNSWIR